MAGIKQPVTFQIQADALRMLEAAAAQYHLSSVDKALRCVLDYIATEADWDSVFADLRCERCGGRPGWTGPKP